MTNHTIRLFSFCLLFSTVLQAQTPRYVSLNSDWRFRSTTSLTPPNDTVLGQNISNEGYTTQFPNTILSALRENKAIEEPITAENAARLQWLESKDWIFERRFDLDAQTLEAEKIDLILRGVDTYALVFLNGTNVFKTDNPSEIWWADVKKLLKPKGNLLNIYFAAIAKNNQLPQKITQKDAKKTVNLKSCGVQTVELNLGGSSKQKEKISNNVPLKSEQKTPKEVVVVVEKKPLETSLQAVENMTWTHKVENDTFKLTVVNDRSTKVYGYFFLDVYDVNGAYLFKDTRLMFAAAGSAVEFYKYNLKTLLQGRNSTDVVFVMNWKDGYNEPQEMKETFYLSKPTTTNAAKPMALKK